VYSQIFMTSFLYYYIEMKFISVCVCAFDTLIATVRKTKNITTINYNIIILDHLIGIKQNEIFLVKYIRL